MFTATALLLVVGIALLMQAVGLSPALGTFLAGVVLADSEYRHELEGDIEPFKGLLLGLFFISVGAGIDFGLVAQAPAAILGLVVGIMALKAMVLYVVARLFRSTPRRCAAGGRGPVSDRRVRVRPAGTGARQRRARRRRTRPARRRCRPVDARDTARPAAAHTRLVEPRLAVPGVERPADAIPDEDTPVIVAGFGRVGSTIGRLLRASGVGTTVLDLDGDQIEVLRRMGLEAYYGDATRVELLTAAGPGRRGCWCWRWTTSASPSGSSRSRGGTFRTCS